MADSQTCITDLNREIREIQNLMREHQKRVDTEISNLRRYVWESDVPEVIDLRNELLLATKLTKEDSK